MKRLNWRKRSLRKLFISLILSLLLAIIIPVITFYIAGSSFFWKQWGIGIVFLLPTIFVILVITLFPISLFSDWVTIRLSKIPQRVLSFLIHLLSAAAITFYVQWLQYYQADLALDAPSIWQLLVYSFYNIPAFCAILYWLLDEWWKSASASNHEKKTRSY